MNSFLLLGVILEIIAFAYIILVCFLVYSDKVSVKTIYKFLIGYWSVLVAGIIIIVIGIFTK